jgi:hypothetical protein
MIFDSEVNTAVINTVRSPEGRSLFQRMAERQTFLQSGGGGGGGGNGGGGGKSKGLAAANMMQEDGGNVYAPSELFAPPETMANLFFSPTCSNNNERESLREGL